jgi:hypothetical protein
MPYKNNEYDNGSQKQIKKKWRQEVQAQHWGHDKPFGKVNTKIQEFLDKKKRFRNEH